jgi:hypothetical protein
MEQHIRRITAIVPCFVGARGELRVMPTLARKQIRQFIKDGFIRLDQAFPKSWLMRVVPSYERHRLRSR